MKKIKLLYIISTLRRCGPTNVMWNIIKTLDRTQFDIRIATLSPECPDSIITEVEKAGIRVYKLNCGKLWPVTAIYKLRTLADEFGPDIIHSHGVRPDIAAAFGGKQAITISTIHNVPVAVYEQKYGKIRGKFMTWLQLLSLSLIDMPVSCSRAVNDAWQKTFNLSSEVVSNCIDISGKLNVMPNVKPALKQKFGITAEVPVLISTGGLSKWKRPDIIIRAFLGSRLGKTGVLYLCGTGDMLAECQQLAGDAKNIVFTGQVKNVADYLLAADYYVSASELEGMPNSVLEAMSFELPVIMSMIPAHTEILAHDQGAGQLFTVGDSQELSGIFDGLESLNRDAGQKAKQIVERHFSSKVMGDQYASLYIAAINKEDVCFAKESLNRS